MPGAALAPAWHQTAKQIAPAGYVTFRDPRSRGELPDPAEFLHGPSRVPDLGHVADLAVLELHHIDIVAAGALAGWRHRAALPAVGAREHGIGADVIALLVGGEGLDCVAAVRDEPEQPLHPLGVLLESAQVGERFRLGGEA